MYLTVDYDIRRAFCYNIDLSEKGCFITDIVLNCLHVVIRANQLLLLLLTSLQTISLLPAPSGRPNPALGTTLGPARLAYMVAYILYFVF